QALIHAEYKCAADSRHTTFTTAQGVPYMEGHHLIPCTPANARHFWDTKGRNIDCESNIVCLCPTCHRQIHYGTHDEKKALIEFLFNKQKAKLRSVGLDISLEELWGLYDI
ncbi:MAG: HNH endonuclease, partial [Odoribacter sp.]|nr:HNH endonuclease [Odoribacter sp.]